MRIRYDDQDDILHIELTAEKIVKDISHSWNVNIGYAASGIAEITILDAKANGYWPLENAKDFLQKSTQFSRGKKTYRVKLGFNVKGDRGIITTTHYDVAEHLRTPEEMAMYLDACFEESGADAAFIAKALGDIARAQGMDQVAEKLGTSRESLCKLLSGEQVPSLDTFLKVAHALGIKLHASVQA